MSAQEVAQKVRDSYKSAKAAAKAAAGDYIGATKDFLKDPAAITKGIFDILKICAIILLSLIVIAFCVPVSLIKDVKTAINQFDYQTNYNETEIKVTDIYQNRFTELRKEAEKKAYNICYSDFLSQTYGKGDCVFQTSVSARDGTKYPPKVKICDDCPLVDCDVTQNLSMILAAQQVAGFKDPLSVINTSSFDAINDDVNGLLGKIKQHINSIMYIDYAKCKTEFFVEEHEIPDPTEEDPDNTRTEYWYFYTFNYYVEDLKEDYYYHQLFNLSDKEIEYAKVVEKNVGDITRGSIPSVYESIQSAIAASNISKFDFNNTKALTFPTDGSYTITSYFGMRFDPLSFKPSFHTGIDVVGFNVVGAAGDGVVAAAGSDHDIFGTYCVIYHGDYCGEPIYTLYGHMKEGSLKVGVGETVTQKQSIGIVGSSGRSTGDHLHFEIIKGTEYVNPVVSPLLSTPSRPSYIATVKDWISGLLDKIFG